MKKILVCQHVAHEPLGTLDPLLRAGGFRIRYVNFGRTPHEKPTLKGYAGLIVLGGPMNVDETLKHPHLEHEVGMIREAIRRDIPVLGICLGAQLIAKALGAIVTKNPVKEIGWYDVTPTLEGESDPLLSKFSGTEKIFQWHGDTFSIPQGAVHLASSKACTAQAFRYGDKVYGFQFHLEVDEKLIRLWCEVPVNQPDLREMAADPQTEKILLETPRFIPLLTELSQHVFVHFMDLFGSRQRFKRLESK
ncbi:MAG: gamma-glutamyl-gamma-aminobutyrate hydrolase family protein [Deltaproteobacteria bacterium]|nr:gamma-glutamyl-gamma-aminobutyrate hydrolase family protein [Deltaproteobacteria bacterium]